ncbi:hypothetical protein BJ875DRAFT_375144 [Amylocarpus encephaloides]|uniref:BZIP domain-containing protein n=1 Tax=Amylocarpus encephaloides TaxID=45428 RepID=A0A9P7YK19_9HELO|nr:hypothetical protein BJ875DRAFT_375144 [Amylocarpus encephaloides]
MSLQSPVDQYGNKLSGSGYGSSGQSDSGKSPLSMSLGFLKNLTEKKSTRVDGQPPKRRGPKPDSKPALTRRQELNRQAQRTHRERKELYIKALEQEVIRLKENFSMVSQTKESLAEENRQLKQLLAQHGIPWHGTGGVDELLPQASADYTSSGSISGSYAPGSQGYSPPPTHSATSATNSQFPHRNGANNGRNMAQQQVQQGVDYDQAGIDFVLTLERPCMDHLQYLVELSSDAEGPACGHTLMASCPPMPDVKTEIPFGHGPRQNAEAQKTWDLSKSDLANLLDLSKRLNLDGEITPVMAWGMILSHDRFSELKAGDFEKMSQELRGKIRCYGFGAVLEEFELRDAIANVLHNDFEEDMMY